MTTEVEQYSLMKLAFKSFETPFAVGSSSLSENARELQRPDRRSWFGEPSVLKDRFHAILSEEPWMGHTTFRFSKIIFWMGQEHNLDTDPKHTRNVAKQFLDKEVPETIDWPSNSPDINPTENLWSIIKRNVEKRRSSNIDELEEFLNQEWENIDLSTLINLVL
jgi:hypothetical protein